MRKEIFARLAEAEARVHNESIEHVHFHEVGALDAIVDVVGAAICFDLLGDRAFRSSPLHVGSGMVEMAHGRFPVPPPAVTELLERRSDLFHRDQRANLLRQLAPRSSRPCASEYGAIPQMKLEQAGYGAGTREYEKFPNALRVLIGESE